MASRARSLVVLAGLCLLAFGVAVNASLPDDTVQEVPLRSHILHQPYLDANLENRYWSFGGSTVVSTNKYVRLTPDRQSKRGWLWSKEPLSVDNWHIEFDFKVDGVGKNVYGDGFAFWFTTEKEMTGPAFGNTAVFNGVGVFFDTFMNTKHPVSFPYVGVMVNDGTKAYTNDDDNFLNNNGGCEARFRKSPFPTRARITYFGKTLKVDLDVGGSNQWMTCVTLNNVQLPPAGYVGFTAATGDVADDHDILSVTTTQYILPDRPQVEALRRAAIPQDIPAAKRGTKAEKVKNESAPWQAFVWTVVVVVALVGVAVVGYLVKQNVDKNRKRF